MNSNREADVELSNGAKLNFKIARDVAGNPVISSLNITFHDLNQIPIGGIGASLLREISLNELLAIWFQESNSSFLSQQEEKKIWKYLSGDWPWTGRQGLPLSYYACLGYFYVQFCEEYPSRPTAELAKKMNVGVKTLSSRLTQARRLGVLTSTNSRVSTGRAGGAVSSNAKKAISELLRESR